MVWFKVDDNLAFHQKTIAAGNAAMGLWVRAGALCAQQLTDGFVSTHLVRTMGKPSEARSLVNAGLWHQVEGGFQFHQWAEDGRQPTREHVEAERAAARERMAARRRKRGKRAPEVQANTERTSDEVRDAFGDPDPTRPDPTSSSYGTTPPSEGPDKPTRPAKRATQLPSDFAPNDTNRRVADEHGVELDRVLPQFVDHHRAKGSTFKDWHAALNTWLRRERPTKQPVRGGDVGAGEPIDWSWVPIDLKEERPPSGSIRDPRNAEWRAGWEQRCRDAEARAKAAAG